MKQKISSKAIKNNILNIIQKAKETINKLYVKIKESVTKILPKIKAFPAKINSITEKLPFNKITKKCASRIPFLNKISSRANYIFISLIFVILILICIPHGNTKNPVAGKLWKCEVETFGTINLKKNYTFICKSDILDVSKGEYKFDEKSNEIVLYDRANSKYLTLYYNRQNKTIEYRILGIKAAIFKK